MPGTSSVLHVLFKLKGMLVTLAFAQDAFITDQMQDIAAMRPSTVDPETGERYKTFLKRLFVEQCHDYQQEFCGTMNGKPMVINHQLYVMYRV